MIGSMEKLQWTLRILGMGLLIAVVASLILWLLGYAVVVDYALLLVMLVSAAVMVGFTTAMMFVGCVDTWAFVIWMLSVAIFFGTGGLYELLFGF
jgi:hypothetical protein